jgi:hypothetical protein
LGSGFAAGGGGGGLDFFLDDDFFDDDFFEDDEPLLFLSAARAACGSLRPSGMAWGASSATISQGMGVIRCLLLERRVGARG